MRPEFDKDRTFDPVSAYGTLKVAAKMDPDEIIPF